jgi:hypothetical protein
METETDTCAQCAPRQHANGTHHHVILQDDDPLLLLLLEQAVQGPLVVGCNAVVRRVVAPLQQLGCARLRVLPQPEEVAVGGHKLFGHVSSGRVCPILADRDCWEPWVSAVDGKQRGQHAAQVGRPVACHHHHRGDGPVAASPGSSHCCRCRIHRFLTQLQLLRLLLLASQLSPLHCLLVGRILGPIKGRAAPSRRVKVPRVRPVH